MDGTAVLRERVELAEGAGLSQLVERVERQLQAEFRRREPLAFESIVNAGVDVGEVRVGITRVGPRGERVEDVVLDHGDLRGDLLERGPAVLLVA